MISSHKQKPQKKLNVNHNLKSPSCTDVEACKRGHSTWLWNPGQTSSEVQRRDISGPTKRLMQTKLLTEVKQINKTTRTTVIERKVEQIPISKFIIRWSLRVQMCRMSLWWTPSVVAVSVLIAVWGDSDHNQSNHVHASASSPLQTTRVSPPPGISSRQC